jgi:hypothetical protein
MTAVIPQAQSLAGNARLRTAAAAQRLAGAPELSAEAKRLDAIDNAEFDRQAALFVQPTLARPALLASDEVDSIRAGYNTGAGRLNVLVAVTGKRMDYYAESRGGGAPFDPISPADRAKCEAFFAKHGTRLADQPRKAPDNPLKPKPNAETIIEKSKVSLSVTATTPPASYSQGAGAALDKSIVDADDSPGTRTGTARPANGAHTLAAPAAPVLLPPPATLTIEFVSSHGFHCELTLHAPSGTAVLEQGKAAMAKLVEQQAKPAPVAPAAPAASVTGNSTAGAPPVCKYHGAMKPSKKPGTWFCPKKMQSGEYCDQKFEEAA